MVMTWEDFLHNAVVFAKQLLVQFMAACCVHSTVTGADSVEENAKVNGQVPDIDLCLQRTHAVIDGTSEVRKPFWWRALDAEFGKDFLDDLQLCVDQGNGSFLVRRERLHGPQRSGKDKCLRKRKTSVCSGEIPMRVKQEFCRKRQMAKERCARARWAWLHKKQETPHLTFDEAARKRRDDEHGA